MHLKALFDACMGHGYISVSCKTGIIVSVPKSEVHFKMSCEKFVLIIKIPNLSKMLACCV